MKKLVIIVLLIVNFSYGQDFTGKAIYKTFRKVTINPNHAEGGLDAVSQKKLEEKLKKKLEKTFTLNFTKSMSTYIQNKELETGIKSNGVKVVTIGNGGGDVFYKDISKKKYINKKDMMGKVFLIKDVLRVPNWDITTETKKIGNYTCYKAIRYTEKEQVSVMMTDGKNEMKKEKVTVVITAWYTPEIAINNGPEDYWGLPGLILEVQEGKKTIACSEIVLNSKKTIKLEAPKKGKKVNQKEFDAILSEKEKEIMERFRFGGKGGGINIQTN